MTQTVNMIAGLSYSFPTHIPHFSAARVCIFAEIKLDTIVS